MMDRGGRWCVFAWMRRRSDGSCCWVATLWLVACGAAGRVAEPRAAVADETVAPVPVAVASAVAPTERDVVVPEVEPEPKLAPPPSLPAGDHVTVTDLVAALEQVALDLEHDPAMLSEYETWIASHDLVASDRLFRDYVRVRMIFECARDGGLWRVRWDITNEEPNSDRIWAQWTEADPSEDAVATAVAECDELSALFAHLVRRLGVEDVGLFWPVWNHVVAVWTVPGVEGPVRVVVPTSQIMLDDGESLGTSGFNPRKQKTIYEYRRRDTRDATRVPAALARFFVEQAWTGMRRTQAELQVERNRRSALLGGS